MDTSLQVRLPDGHDIVRFEALLVDECAFKVEGPVSETWTFYDTFDWRLFDRSLALHQSGHEFSLHRLSDGQRLQSVMSGSSPAFAWDLPDSSLKKRLVSIMKVRALLMLADIHLQSRTYHILNADEKTVARLVHTEARAIPDGSGPVLAAYLSLRPVRGYPRWARQVAKHLRRDGHSSTITKDIYFRALEAAGKVPGSYSASSDLQLAPGMRSDEATKAILRRQLEIMRANEAGIRADIDTEFLHDYRIAIRRTRSTLSQVKNVFSTENTLRFKGDFAYLGKGTNELRDLDVYLLFEGRYRAMLPDGMRDGMTPLFDYLRAQRGQALKGVVEGLESERYARILHDWEALLNDPVAGATEAANAAVPIIDVARQRIYKRFQRVVKDGNYILEHTEDKLLHALRIECKKLRYLMELFASLFPRKKVARLISQLKRLQDNLGEFNDLSVQQEYLLSIAEELPVGDRQTRRALIATGILVESLSRRQQVVKAGFAKSFTDFSSPANKKLHRELFSTKKKGAAS